MNIGGELTYKNEDLHKLIFLCWTKRFSNSVILDWKTVVFFFWKSVKKPVKRGVRVSLSVFSLVSDRWLLARTWIRKNTDCFAVCKLIYTHVKYKLVPKNNIFSTAWLGNKMSKSRSRPFFDKRLKKLFIIIQKWENNFTALFNGLNFLCISFSLRNWYDARDRKFIVKFIKKLKFFS